MEGKKVYIVMDDGWVSAVFDSKEKAEAYMREGFPNDYTPEEIEEELEELRQEGEYYIMERIVR